MKLRVIIVALSLMAFFSALAGGYIYYSSVRNAAIEEAKRQATLHTEALKGHFSFFLQENLNSVIALAGLKDLSVALNRRDPDTLEAANAILDHFRKTYNADVCYLIDPDGLTIASSNRHAPDSFVGHNYAFRPYFQRAISGVPEAIRVYMALGVTSGKRGIYYSYPVYDEYGDAPIGVAVIKAPIEPLERELFRDYEGIVMLTDPRGIIFISSRPDWIFKTLSALPADDIAKIREDRQFGDGPWEWAGLSMTDAAQAFDSGGNKYLSYNLSLESYPGWNLIFLSDINPILRRVYDPLIRSSGYLIIALSVFIGLMIMTLFLTANREISRRHRAEEALRRSRSDLEKRVVQRTAELTASVNDLQREVAERKRVEEALRGSEEKHRTLTENLSVGVFRSTPGAKGKYIDVNQAFMRMFGFNDKAALLSLHAYDLYRNPEDRDAFSKKMIRHGAVQNEEIVFKRHDGSTFLGAVTAVAIKDADGNVRHYDGILEDITELRQAQEEARKRREEIAHLGRVATMGELSASLAHELNQPLTAILSNAQAALRFLAGGKPDMDEIRDILADVVADDRRAGKVIERLRRLYRKGDIQKAPVDVNELIQEVISFITAETMIRNISIETSLDRRLPLVSGDKIHLQQVLINFILNASDAMNQNDFSGRKMVVSTRLVDDHMVQVSIMDNGIGLPHEVPDQVIEPFYTTKADGMGMGLSINRTIITAHSGRMWAENNLEKGATFHFTLPVCNEV